MRRLAAKRRVEKLLATSQHSPRLMRDGDVSVRLESVNYGEAPTYGGERLSRLPSGQKARPTWGAKLESLTYYSPHTGV